MELAANVWPIADSLTGLVQRFLMRAYAFDAGDDVIRRTLAALAPADFLMARAFPIPRRFRVSTPHGELAGCVGLALFQQSQFEIIEDAFEALESEHAQLQGISVTGPQPIGIGQLPRFPEDPFLVVTVLVETPEGRLIPQLSQT